MAKTSQKRIIILSILLILFFSSLVYLYRLDKTPVHLNQDELAFSLNAYSISETLHDASGKFLPFYFWHLDNFWATPIIVYLTSIFLKFLPFSEATIRVPSVFVGLTSIFLIMLLIQKMFKDKRFIIFSGILMATTPVFFIQSRLLLDNLYIVPFVLLWLLFLKIFLEKRNDLALFISGLSLGIGIHSYHAAKIMMPIYFITTIILLSPKTKRDFKSLVVLLLGFLIPIAAFIPWLTKYPGTLLSQVSYIGSMDKAVDVGRGIWGVFSFSRLGSFISSYFSYFHPRILFTVGDISPIHSTGQVGVFLFPVLFLLVFGILEVLSNKKDKFSRLILFGFLTYPIAPAIVSQPQRVSRGLVIIPFVILLSIYGISFLLKSREKSFKPFLVAIFILCSFQFAFFLNDYFGEYRERSYREFNNNIGGGLESVLRSTEIRNIDTIYFDRYIPFISYYSQFYQIKLDKDIKDKQVFFDYKTVDFSKFAPGSIVLIGYDHAPPGRQDHIGPFEKIEIIREPNGYETFYVYYRDR